MIFYYVLPTFLKSRFDVEARCFWLTERVWEQTCTMLKPLSKVYIPDSSYWNIIGAEPAFESGNTSKNRNVKIEEKDFDFDGIDEISIQNKWHKLYIQPHSGGRIYEWTISLRIQTFLIRSPEDRNHIIRLFVQQLSKKK